MYNAWNTTVKLVWGCPQQTRTYFVQRLLSCGFSSARTDLLSRFVNFFQGLRGSASLEVRILVRLLVRDLQSITGKSLYMIKELTN